MLQLEKLYVEHDGVRMHVLAAGQGEPLVLVHGYGGSSDAWFFNMADLAQHYRVYAVDLPGSGQSTKVVLRSLEDFAGWLCRLLDHCGHDSAHIAGNSMGGAIAVQFALQWPDRAKALLLAAPLGLGKLGAAEFGPRMATAQSEDEVRELLCLVVHDPAVVIPPMIERQVAMRQDPQALAVVGELGPVIFGWEAAFEHRLGELTCPTLILWGKQDRVLPVENIQVAAGLANVRTRALDACGHLPQVELPGVFNQLALEFLASVR